jgi:hypothetical protein
MRIQRSLWDTPAPGALAVTIVSIVIWAASLVYGSELPREQLRLEKENVELSMQIN